MLEHAARSAVLERYHVALQSLADQNRLRVLSSRSGLDFTSNDYLGLATSQRIAGVLTAALARGTAIGAGGSRLLRGNVPEHEELEGRCGGVSFALNAPCFSAAATSLILPFSRRCRRAMI